MDAVEADVLENADVVSDVEGISEEGGSVGNAEAELATGTTQSVEFSIEPGSTLNNDSSLTITCEDDIYYTINGQDPTSSDKYESSIDLKPTVGSTSMTIKYYVVGKGEEFDSAENKSNLQTAEYNFQVAPLTIKDKKPTYTTSDKIELECATNGVQIMYSLDGGELTETYSGQIELTDKSASFTLKAKATKANYADNTELSEEITISTTPDEAPKVPEATPTDDAEVEAGSNITLKSDEGATIYYIVNKGDNASEDYSDIDEGSEDAEILKSADNVASNITSVTVTVPDDLEDGDSFGIKAVAETGEDSNYKYSDVVEFTYTIKNNKSGGEEGTDGATYILDASTLQVGAITTGTKYGDSNYFTIINRDTDGKTFEVKALSKVKSAVSDVIGDSNVLAGTGGALSATTSDKCSNYVYNGDTAYFGPSVAFTPTTKKAKVVVKFVPKSDNGYIIATVSDKKLTELDYSIDGIEGNKTIGYSTTGTTAYTETFTLSGEANTNYYIGYDSNGGVIMSVQVTEIPDTETKSLADADVKLSMGDVEDWKTDEPDTWKAPYTGDKIIPEVSVTISGAPVDSKDYTVTYANKSGDAEPDDGDYKDASNADLDLVSRGKISVKVSANSVDYADSAEPVEFEIVKGKAPEKQDAAYVVDVSKVTSDPWEVDLNSLFKFDEKYGDVTYSDVQLENAGSNVLDDDPDVKLKEEKSSILTFKTKNTVEESQTAAVIKVTARFEDYEDTTVTLNITLASKKEVTITGITVETPKTYDGKAVEPDKAEIKIAVKDSVDEDVTDIVKDDLVASYTTKEGVALEEAPKDVGEYTLKFSVPASNAEYSGESDPIDFKITEATLTLTAKDRDWTIGYPAPSATAPYTNEDNDWYKVEGLVEGETLAALEVAPSFSYKIGDTDVDWSQVELTDTIVIVPSLEGLKNYTVNTVNGTLRVNEAPQLGEGEHELHLTRDWAFEDGKFVNNTGDSYFTVEGDQKTASAGNSYPLITYGEYTTVLKMNSNGSVKFNAPEGSTLEFIVHVQMNKDVKVNVDNNTALTGTASTKTLEKASNVTSFEEIGNGTIVEGYADSAPTDNTVIHKVTMTLGEGDGANHTHTIDNGKKGEFQLYYVKVTEPGGSDIPPVEDDDTVVTPTVSPNGGTVSTSQSITLSSTTAGATFKYTLNGDDPSLEAATGIRTANPFNLSEFKEGDTVVLKAIAVKDGLKDSGLLTATFTVEKSAPGPIVGDGLQIVLIEDEYTYTGSAIVPKYSVTYGDEPLIEGTDYTVKCSNNVKVSTTKPATITVTGKGNLSGKTSAEFKINPKDLNDEEIKGKVIVAVSGTKAALPALTYNGIKLTSKDIQFKEDLSKYKWTDEDEDRQVTIEAGKSGNFTGSCDVTVDIITNEEKKAAQIKKVTLSAASGIYNDADHEPEVTVTVTTEPEGGLIEGTDYNVSYPSDMKSAGKKKITVTGISSKCFGTKTVTYTINPAAKTGRFIVKVNDSEEIIRPFQSTGVTFAQDELAVSYSDGGDVLVDDLKNGRDYKITYSKNKNAGVAKATVSGLGNYKGVKTTVEFGIAEVDFADSVDVIVPDKASSKPKSFKSTPVVIEKSSNTVLKPSAYKVSYTDENGTVIKEAAAGTTVHVRIEPKANSGFTAETPLDVTYEVKESSKDVSTAKIKLLDSNGKSKFYHTGEDVKPYQIVLTYKDKSVDTLTLGEDGEYTGENATNYDITFVNNINKGKATVIVQSGNDAYAVGGKSATFSIAARNLKEYLGW